MKIRIGSGPVTSVQSSRLKDIQKKIEDNIFSAVVQEAIEVSRPRLQKLGQIIYAAANLQATRIFPTIVDVIESGSGGLNGARLMGSLWAPTVMMKESTGSIQWPPLNFRYALSKERTAADRLRARKRVPSRAAISRAAAKAGSFFILTGKLKSYFKRSSLSIVYNRFGGVDVHVDVERGFKSNRIKVVNTRETEKGRDTARIELGRITVKIFPRITPSMMPMLASGRWTDVTRYAEFERALLPANQANKLSGGRGPYRPLVLPVTQFFMLNRIPAAIRQALSKQLSSTKLGVSISG